MDQKFTPPKDHAEFIQRADKMTLVGAKGVLNALEGRRKGMTANIDSEINHIKKVIEHKSEVVYGQTELDSGS